ncbi:MAG: 4Fe-4S binding protein, partial [Gammaproteobacteria bacterium]|nr:4Fe-4S binding protein [Gammaproteobacteria bacterium]
MNEMNNQTISAATIALKGFQSKPTSLISYQSNGRVLVIGDSNSLELCKDFSDPLSTTLLLMTGSPVKSGNSNMIAIDNRKIDIKGHLGDFEITLADTQGKAQTLSADLILDLNTEALLKHEVLPSGYFHATISVQNQQELQQKLVDMTGKFEKPKYFNYNAAICAHGVNGKTVCTNCIDACPAGAITSLIEKIEVDPYLCLGGGTCATVCPSGAIQYAYPRLSDSGNRIRKMLQAYRDSGGENPVVMFHTEQEFKQNLEINYLPVRVEELASVGMELCLSTLVYGASQVVLLVNDEMPDISVKQLSQQLDWLQTMLMGLDLKPLMVTMQKDFSKVMPVKNLMQIEPALYSMPD